MNRSAVAGLALLLFCLASLQGCARIPLHPRLPVELTYADLANDLVDLERLALIPSQGESCAQWSSYARTSRYDAKTGRYVDWDANADNRGSIREEGGRFVLAEMKGPGCIRRIWSAAPGAGHVLIYLDGAEEPAVDLPFEGYFNGKNPPFDYPSLVYEAARGMNCYVPIPYQKSCKIVADKDWGAYYHFTYTTFPEGTKVPTFERQISPTATAGLDPAKVVVLKREFTRKVTSVLDRADGILSNRMGQDPRGVREGAETISRSIDAQPGKTVKIAQIQGPRAISALRVKLKSKLTPAQTAALLREVALRISWDGEKTPSVWTPLGDFFGTAIGANEYRSLPLGVTTKDGFYAFWFMPFSREAVVEIANEGAIGAALDFEIVHAPLPRPVGEYGRFHAKWHRDAYLPQEVERAIDWTMLKTKGRGRFCGVMLHIWNPKGGWWGEGDEKFFVDGEKFPSTFGTGSEDYFGYAWGCPRLFEYAFHDQTLNRANNVGNVAVNRWHIADNVPFERSFEGSIERYARKNAFDEYACVAYWYLAPGGDDSYVLPPAKERTNYYAYLMPTIERSGARIGPSTLHVAEITGGTTSWPQREIPSSGPKKQSKPYIGWEGARQNDRLVLETLPFEKAGVYTVSVELTQGPGFGVVQLYLDGKKLGKPVDLRSKEIGGAKPLEFAHQSLNAGPHQLTVEIVEDFGAPSKVGVEALAIVAPDASTPKPQRGE